MKGRISFDIPKGIMEELWHDLLLNDTSFDDQPLFQRWQIYQPIIVAKINLLNKIRGRQFVLNPIISYHEMQNIENENLC